MVYMAFRPGISITCVQADVGTHFEHTDGEGTWMTQISSENHGPLMDGMNWLHNEGYTTQEDSLGALYGRITMYQDFEHVTVEARIYSRPL
jgi:hypothetical protein